MSDFDDGDFSQGGREERREKHWDLTGRILGACIEVHRHCGPGLLESVYEECLAYELRVRGLRVQRQTPVTLEYKALRIDGAYRADLLVEEVVLLELKAVDALLPIHLAQLLSYLKLADVEVGLVVNFNTPYLRDGVRRLFKKPGASRYPQAIAKVPWPEDP